MIAAAGENNELGKDNDLLWHLPDDFKRFKTLTSGHYIIMGRKTFESFSKPLPNRTHIIITRDRKYLAPQECLVAHSLQEALKMVPKDEIVYIIGGGEIYRQAIALANCIELTRVHHSFEADAFFPQVDLKEWKLDATEFHDKDEKHKYSFAFETYKRYR